MGCNVSFSLCEYLLLLTFTIIIIIIIIAPAPAGIAVEDAEEVQVLTRQLLHATQTALPLYSPLEVRGKQPAVWGRDRRIGSQVLTRQLWHGTQTALPLYSHLEVRECSRATP